MQPLGVGMEKGCGKEFWICLCLTLFGYIPGTNCKFTVYNSAEFFAFRADLCMLHHCEVLESGIYENDLGMVLELHAIFRSANYQECITIN